MRVLIKNVSTILNNENGGPNVETLIGIGVAMAVGSGLFLFGAYVYDWFEGPASDTISDIGLPDNSCWII